MAPSPKGSIVLLPPLVPLPPDVRSDNVRGIKEKESGFIGRWVRGNRGSEVDLTRGGVVREEMVPVDAEANGKLQQVFGDDVVEDETYLTLDDI